MMRKSVEFYKVLYNFHPITLGLSEKELKDIFISEIVKSIANIKDNIVEINSTDSSSVIIEVLEHDKTHLFGIIGKLEDLDGGLLKRLRNKTDLGEKDDKIDTTKFYLENYTYFYIRLIDMYCAVLSNYSAPRFKTHFENYLKIITKGINACVNTTGVKKIDVVPIYDDQIEYKLNIIQTLSEMNMIFYDSSNIGNNILDIYDTFSISQSDLRKARLSLNLKMTKVNEVTKNMLKNDELIKSNFEKLELIGEGSESEEIQVELVEKLLKKKIEIEIDEKYLRTQDDLTKIKEALLGSINPI